jgi:hypothetical protein
VRALRDVLHGDGAYAGRFDGFVGVHAPLPWTIATLFSASIHPAEHFFVKPTVNQRQAKVLGLAEPPSGPPSAQAYAQHLAIAHATRDRLQASRLEPRDLFDVYTFGWRTLSRSATAATAGAA